MPPSKRRLRASSAATAAGEVHSAAATRRRLGASDVAQTLDEQHSGVGHEMQHVSDDASAQHASDGATAAQHTSNADSSRSGTFTALRLSRWSLRPRMSMSRASHEHPHALCEEVTE